MTVEVKAKLTLDDNASAATKELKESFEQLHHSAEKTQEGLTAMKLVLSELATHALEQGLEKVKEFGESLLESASHGEQVTQRIAGMTAAVQGVPWDQAKESATSFFEKVQDVAIDTRQPIDDVEAGFNRLVEIQGATPAGLAKSLEQTEQMANVARTLGTSVELIGGQFAFMEEGALKVKSQMYQLLQPTGIFEHKTGKVTEWWGKLTNESRAELLATGLEKMSSRMANAAPTFKDTVNQLDNVWATVKERLGSPFIEALAPQIQKVEKELLGSTHAIDGYAQKLGVEVGDWVKAAAEDVKEGFQFIEDHEQEIGADIKEAWGFAKGVMQFIIDHKEVLAAVMIARSEMGKGAIAAAPGAFGALSKIGSGMASGIGVSAEANLAGAAVSASLALGVLAVAVGSVALAVDQWDDLMKVTGGGKSEARMDYSALQKQFEEAIKAPDMSQWGSKELGQFDHMRENFVHLAEELGESGRAAGELADKAYAAHQASESIVAPLKAAADAFDSLLISSGQMDSGGAVEKIADGFAQASNMHNTAAQQYIANILSSDAALQVAFLNSSNMTAQGYADLAAMVSDSASEFKNKLMSLASEGGAKPKEVKPVVNFNGGQSFKINQDFRDADPDRIAVLFRNDILKSAERRVQAVNGTPFGS